MVKPVNPRWDRVATRYDRASDRIERLTIGDSRAWVGGRAAGRTLEVAAGTGRNLDHYPAGVVLTMLDASPGMLAVARGKVGPDVALVEGTAEKLPFGDAEFDTVVCTMAVCAVADRAATIAEMWRVLRPGGRLLLLDHLEPRWLRGRPATLAVRQGFRAVRRERLRLGVIERFEAIKDGGVKGGP